ncbi:hypothetical protein K435DRAFT_857172 [Dendrothele bispora CBS 962.96]|uniref:Uncharacterized protein n=1 Tax=Dendrothele bispora (strain CBS 962.96) TaxID=1314807 RepID=A0A4S8M6N8_DENBC|nr:hypothetical protein K435DRAFT_857172 [Dendrothele bispora CBS 962.96]
MYKMLPDVKVFMVANNQLIVYDVEASTETILHELPNGKYGQGSSEGVRPRGSS